MNGHDSTGLLTGPLDDVAAAESPNWELSRREFFRIAGVGLAVGLVFVREVDAQPGPRGGRGGGAAPREIGAWLHIGADGGITVYTGKVEIGQNIRTSLTQAVADELRTPPGQIRLVMADTAAVPFDMGTFGSRTTPTMAPQLRRAAAAAREALIDLAAEQSKLDRGAFTVADGRVAGPGGKPAFGFGELTGGKKMMTVIGPQTTNRPEKWTVAGKSVPKVGGRAFVTGGHEYASDVRRPGMMFGKVLRPPAYKSKPASVDTSRAEALPGVTVVRNGEFVGVVAPSVHAAESALATIKAGWEPPPAQVSSDDLFRHLKAKARGRGDQGAVEAALKASDKVVRAAYTVAYIAHVPLEPRAAVAEWSADGRLTVWTGTQRPFGVRGELVAAFGLTEDRVRVIVPDMGSGYGGKHTGEVAIEAARLAKAAGKPVKLVWTREEEFTWAYFRPAGVIEVAAGVSADGRLAAWDFHNYNSGPSGLRTPYDVPNPRAEVHQTDSPLKQGAYRGLAATANHFARESVMDELAHAVGADPLAFRLKNLKDARLRAVLEVAAKKFDWGKQAPAGRGYGLALGTEKQSYVASCAEVEIDRDKKQVRVVRVVTAFECGAVINPNHLTNQVEGAVMMGLGGALFERIEFANGKILNPSLADYRVPRFKDAPALETVLLDRRDLPSEGAGETPIVAVAPAVGNAIFQATGVRLRSMPMVPDGFTAG